MKNIDIKINRKTSMVYLENTTIGNDGENLQGDIIFSFVDTFVDGQARLEYEIDGEKHFILLEKDGETYKTPIKSVLTKTGSINMQLVVTEGIDENNIPIFKSNVFYVYCNNSINAEIEQPDEYAEWIDVASTKLNTIDNAIEKANNVNIDAVKEENVVKITITNRDGVEKEVNIKDGEKGVDGEPGKDGINGKDGKDGVDGKDYVITSEDYEEISTVVETNLQPTLSNNLKSSKDYTDNAITKDIKDISYNQNTATFTFTRHDNTTITIDLPLEQTVKDGRYDDDTNELVLVLVSGQEIKIPVTGLIDDYDGVTSATIQCVVSADNKITCNIKSGSVSKTLLTTDLQNEINDKVNTNTFNTELGKKLSTNDVTEEQYTITYEDGTTRTIKAVVYK